MTGERQTDESLGGPFERGPFVLMATLCERVLKEADGVLSIIRVVDRIDHTAVGPDAPREMPEVRSPLTLAVILVPGAATGRHEITIVVELPSGETLPPITTSVQFEGASRPIRIVAPLNIPYTIEGLYWFHVRFDENLRLTQIPLQVRYSRQVMGSGSQTSG